MKTAIQLEVTFDQVLSLVRRLPKKDKIRLTKELEKDVVNTKLTKLLKTFNANDLELSDIDSEVEDVRQEIYEKQTDQSDF
ncbi:MAG: hypothetical protein VB074_14195 [Proteiniphilum sp.]|jgi:hypothetical protein|uniref:type II toxin-antitoxin system VapB15 family antitoxin n=1 Tax=Proteiniphilum sp. TaxID=1926877 RepID=UPI0009297772|nr:hypothetical protein [Proteiniphilum sp.]MEA5129327.1 hypothetical protein [Proteiniphilum sp.]OJV87404.1 MAG: hypothetical protein BGO34_09935 [Bacteroidia bacterium 44-10]